MMQLRQKSQMLSSDCPDLFLVDPDAFLLCFFFLLFETVFCSFLPGFFSRFFRLTK